MIHGLKFAEDPPAGRPSDDSLCAIRKRTASDPQPEEERIIRFLQAGIDIAASACFRDLIKGSDVEAVVFMTDGEWVWTNALLYYVRNYHWRVEPEFVEHMRARQWHVPARDDVDLKAVIARYRGSRA